MREVLYRGKNEVGKWVFGGLVINETINKKTGETHVSYFIVTNVNGYYSGGKFPGDLMTAAHRVIPETVGEYTGLLDKNGVKIFEGDIVKVSDKNSCRDPSVFHVYWNNEEASFDTEIIDNGGYVSDLENAVIGGEVIGNTHDNPELLEVNHG